MVFPKTALLGLVITSLTAGLVTAEAASRKTQPKPKSKEIVCEQEYLDYDQSPAKTVLMSRVVIQLDSSGQAESMMIHKKEDEEVGELNLLFDRSNATITHVIEKNRVDSVDEETGEPVYSWGIEDVEAIQAVGNHGIGFKITINDHRYAGPLTGSTTYFLKNGEATELLHGGDMMIVCEGPLRLK